MSLTKSSDQSQLDCLVWKPLCWRTAQRPNYETCAFAQHILDQSVWPVQPWQFPIKPKDVSVATRECSRRRSSMCGNSRYVCGVTMFDALWNSLRRAARRRRPRPSLCRARLSQEEGGASGWNVQRAVSLRHESETLFRKKKGCCHWGCAFLFLFPFSTHIFSFHSQDQEFRWGSAK